MKLISKTILYYLLISLPLLIIAGFLSYYLIKKEIHNGTDEAIWKEKLNAEKLIKNNPTIKTNYFSLDSLSFYTITSYHKTSFLFSDSLLFDKYENEDLNYRFLSSYVNINDQTYFIRVAKTTLEEDDLIESLYKTFTIIILFLMLAFFVVNWMLSKTIWKPFYTTLDKLNSYDLKNYGNEIFETSSTKEFAHLNQSLNQMTKKIYTDYLQQKEFTENASHEMQTPLAIIKANINLLMQSPNLKEEEMEQLQAIDNTTKKLSSLNKALLLLAKIENKQFQDPSEISIQSVINKVLLHFEDLLSAKNISIETHFTNDITININPTLADILVTNLIQNAIRHNFNAGKINIELKNNSLIVSNTGNPHPIQNENLFVRFKKDANSKESIGLGLSIVKSILSTYGYDIQYSYQNAVHSFMIKF